MSEYARCGNSKIHDPHWFGSIDRFGSKAYCYGSLRPPATYRPSKKQVLRAAKRIDPAAWNETTVKHDALMMTGTEPHMRMAFARQKQERRQEAALIAARYALESLKETKIASAAVAAADALESVRAERDAALVRIAEAAKLHWKRKHWNSDREYVFVCDECTRINRYGIAHWPCPTAKALGLNE